MIDYSRVETAEKSWMYNLTQAAKNAQIKYIFQSCDIKMSDGGQFEVDEPFFLIGPARSIDESLDEPGTILLNFDIIVISSQLPGETLKAHQENNRLRQIIEQALFAKNKLDFNAMAQKEYTLPLLTFDSAFNVVSAVGGQMLYQRSAWNDNSQFASPTRVWVMTISVNVIQGA